MKGKIPKNKVKEFIKNPKKGLFTLAIPTLIGMLVQTLYNITDTAFVGHLGAESLAAVTFSFPLFFIVIALGNGVSIGMQSRISRYLGAKQEKAAENTAMHALFLMIGIGAIVTTLGLIFVKQIFALLGATGEALILGSQYTQIVVYIAPLWLLVFLTNAFFQSQGDSKTPMITQIITVVLNIILDPIFIYGLDMGVPGAAIATSISIVVGFIIGLVFVFTRSRLQIHMKAFSFRWHIIKDIFKIGIPASLTMLSMSITFMFFNGFMAHFGTEYVAAIGMSTRLWSLVTMPMVALGFALVTLVGMFWGAERYDLVKGISTYATKIAIGFSIVMGIILAVTAQYVLRIFTSEKLLLDLGAHYVQIAVIALPFIGIAMLSVRSLQGMGYGFPGLIIMLVRGIGVVIPAAALMIYVLNWGYLSVAYAQILAAITGSGIGYLWMKAKIDKKVAQIEKNIKPRLTLRG